MFCMSKMYRSKLIIIVCIKWINYIALKDIYAKAFVICFTTLISNGVMIGGIAQGSVPQGSQL